MEDSHDGLVQFLQVDEDASAMVRRIQSFQLHAGALIAARRPNVYSVGVVPSVMLHGKRLPIKHSPLPCLSCTSRGFGVVGACDAAGVPILDQVGACRKGGAVEVLCAARCSSTVCLQTLIRFLLPSQWQGVALRGLEGSTTSFFFSVPSTLADCSTLPRTSSTHIYMHAFMGAHLATYMRLLHLT